MAHNRGKVVLALAIGIAVGAVVFWVQDPEAFRGDLVPRLITGGVTGLFGFWLAGAVLLGYHPQADGNDDVERMWEEWDRDTTEHCWGLGYYSEIVESTIDDQDARVVDDWN